MPGDVLRIGVVAGETSGDLLGARVLAALKRQYREVRIEGVGGPLMQGEGLASMFPMERLSVMGFTEPLKRLPELLRIRGALCRHFRDDPPDLFLGIDAPDFNLGLERRLRARGVKTAHLVSPSVWAWRRGRIAAIRRAVDLMLCLFPFETPIYRDHDIPAVCVGHPLADEIPAAPGQGAARQSLGLAREGKLLALLPGSRAGEVRLLGPVLLEAAARLLRDDPDLGLVMPAAGPARAVELRALLAGRPGLPVTLVEGRAREAMAAADAVLLASGTATLEAALLGRPMVVTYRMGRFSWWLVNRLVQARFAALPNLLAGRALVPELLQGAATAENLARAVAPLLAGGEEADRQRRALAEIRQDLRRDFSAGCARALAQLAAAGARRG